MLRTSLIVSSSCDFIRSVADALFTWSANQKLRVSIEVLLKNGGVFILARDRIEDAFENDVEIVSDISQYVTLLHKCGDNNRAGGIRMDIVVDGSLILNENDPDMILLLKNALERLRKWNYSNIIVVSDDVGGGNNHSMIDCGHIVSCVSDITNYLALWNGAIGKIDGDSFDFHPITSIQFNELKNASPHNGEPVVLRDQSLYVSPQLEIVDLISKDYYCPLILFKQESRFQVHFVNDSKRATFQEMLSTCDLVCQLNVTKTPPAIIPPETNTTNYFTFEHWLSESEPDNCKDLSLPQFHWFEPVSQVMIIISLHKCVFYCFVIPSALEIANLLMKFDYPAYDIPIPTLRFEDSSFLTQVRRQDVKFRSLKARENKQSDSEPVQIFDTVHENEAVNIPDDLNTSHKLEKTTEGAQHESSRTNKSATRSTNLKVLTRRMVVSRLKKLGMQENSDEFIKFTRALCTVAKSLLPNCDISKEDDRRRLKQIIKTNAEFIIESQTRFVQ